MAPERMASTLVFTSLWETNSMFLAVTAMMKSRASDVIGVITIIHNLQRKKQRRL